MKTRTAIPLRARPRHADRVGASLRRISELGPIALIDASQTGVKPALLRQIQAASPFSEQEWSEILNVTSRTLQRYKQNQKHLDPSTSERVLFIAKLLQRGMQVFGSRERFEGWMQIPSMPLGGRSPKELLRSMSGIQLVDRELTHIEHGILA